MNDCHQWLPGGAVGPCLCGCAHAQQSPQMAGFSDWVTAIAGDSDAAPTFDCKDQAAVAAYLSRAVTTHSIKWALYGFLGGGLVAAFVYSAWKASAGTRGAIGRVREKAIERAGDYAMDRYLPRGR